MRVGILKVLSLFVVALLHTANAGMAQQTDFFWSTKGLNQGAQNGPLFVSAETGDMLSLYLYYSTNGVSDQDLDGGALLDLATSGTGTIRFVAAETFNPQIFAADTAFEYRWFRPMDSGNEFGAAGEIGCVSDFEINEWGAFGITSQGMTDSNTGPLFFDQGYDADADAFLFGRVDIEVIGPGRCAQILAGRGRGGVVVRQGTEAVFFEPVFGSCVITRPGFILGDSNLDGTVNLLDIDVFLQILINGSFQAQSDTNCDNVVDLRDVAPFIQLLLGEGLDVRDPTVEDDVPMPGQLGDSNGDGLVDLLDAECYADSGTDCGFGVPGADITGDGVIDLLDLFAYVDLLLKLK